MAVTTYGTTWTWTEVTSNTYFRGIKLRQAKTFSDQGPVVQSMDKFIQRIGLSSG